MDLFATVLTQKFFPCLRKRFSRCVEVAFVAFFDKIKLEEEDLEFEFRHNDTAVQGIKDYAKIPN